MHPRTLFALTLATALLALHPPVQAQLVDIPTVGMGESAEVGQLTYTVTRSWWQTFTDAEHPETPFLGVELNLVNNGDKRVQIPIFQIYDSRGIRLEPNYSKITWSSMSIAANAEARGVLYFHPPQDLDYRFLVSGPFGSGEFAYIELSPESQ